MTDPTLLRRAIESVGIEKPSDYTLVMEEVERLMNTAPDYEELADALRCLALAYGGRHVRDGLEAIGLGPDATQYVRGKPYDTKEAFEVLARLEDRLGENERADMYRNKRGSW